MLKIMKNIYDLDVNRLMALSDDIDAQDLHEQYSYLLSFFSDQKGIYAIWEEDGRYCSALRIEEYHDGKLITALQTAPQLRNLGYATKLLHAVIDYLKSNHVDTLYSHIHKRNDASVAVHVACGFHSILEHGVLLDGTVSWSYRTYCYKVN